MKRDWAKSFTNIILSPLPKSQVLVITAVKDPVIKYSESAFSNSYGTPLLSYYAANALYGVVISIYHVVKSIYCVVISICDMVISIYDVVM